MTRKLGWLVLLAGVLALAAPVAVVGDWQGVLDTGQGTLRIVVHIAQGADGLTATMDSPDQGVSGIAIDTITFNDPELHFEIAKIAGSFQGKLEKGQLAGQWKQGGGSAPLTLKRAGK